MSKLAGKPTQYTNILFPPESSSAVLQETNGVGFDWTNKKVHLNKLVPGSKCCHRARASWNATAAEIETIPLRFFHLDFLRHAWSRTDHLLHLAVDPVRSKNIWHVPGNECHLRIACFSWRYTKLSRLKEVQILPLVFLSS